MADLTQLDFFGIKENLKDYLKNQSQFRDYDYDGSNMSILLDILAYNTWQNNFYTNMALSEMFLDSANLENSVISHAKELNYLPRSSSSARAVIKIRFRDESTNVQTILIPRYTRFTSRYDNATFTFTTDKTYVARNIGNFEYESEEMEIFEGEILSEYEKEAFLGSDTTGLRCVLNNEKVDTESIRVIISGTDDEYQRRKNIFGVDPSEKVFYIEPHFDRKYAVVFGQNIFGYQPNTSETVLINYRVCNDEEPNGASIFSTNFKPNTEVETIEAAHGGSKREGIEEIRFFAPKTLQIQERTITASDYKILLKQAFPEIHSVAVYGGEELTPPQYGKVAFSIYLRGNKTPSTTKKNEYVSYVSNKSPLSIKPVFIEPAYMHAKISCTINYSKKLTSKTVSNLENLVYQAIQTYSDNYLNDFDVILRLSNLSSIIDSIDTGIISNKLEIQPIIDYFPVRNAVENPSFNFNTPIVQNYPYSSSTGFTNFKPAVQSSLFSYYGECGLLQDDGRGNVLIINNSASNTKILNAKAGIVDYSGGIISLKSFITSDYDFSIKIIADTVANDIRTPQNRILSIRQDDIHLSFTEIT